MTTRGRTPCSRRIRSDSEHGITWSLIVWSHDRSKGAHIRHTTVVGISGAAYERLRDSLSRHMYVAIYVLWGAAIQGKPPVIGIRVTLLFSPTPPPTHTFTASTLALLALILLVNSSPPCADKRTTATTVKRVKSKARNSIPKSKTDPFWGTSRTRCKK